METQDEEPKSNPQLASEDTASKDALKFDLQELQLSQARSDETNPSQASTLYDPAMLALSPEYRAKVEERQTRDPFEEEKKPEPEVPFHVASPARRTVELPVGEATIRLPDEEEVKDEEDGERELCCHGFLPLFPSMIAFNLINIVIGFVCIGIGASQLNSGNKDVVGFGSASRLVVSGSFLLSIFSVILGTLFILCGFLGAAANYAKGNSSEKSWKVSDLVYHCLLFLVTLICVVIFGLNIYSVIVRQSGVVYDTEVWKEFVRSDSKHLCNVEMKLNCAGMSLRQCVSENNETRHTFCPGHFCVDFCRITSGDVSPHPICASCRKDPLNSIPIFIACRLFEQERTAALTCEGLPDKELDKAYGKLFSVAVISFVWILVVWAIIAYVECLL